MMKKSVPASQINRNFPRRSSCRTTVQKLSQKPIGRNIIRGRAGLELHAAPFAFELLELVDFYRRGFAGAGAAEAIFFIVMRCSMTACAGSRRRAQFLQGHPTAVQFDAARSGVAPLLQPSTDVLQEGLYKWAIT